MAEEKTVVYECKKCGTEITVNGAGLKRAVPMYCCGLPLDKKRTSDDRADKKKAKGAVSQMKSAANKAGKISKDK
jgi:hypothetical protein